MDKNSNILNKNDKVEYYDDEYIFYQEGNIPVIITFPHSGTLKFEDIPIRKSGCIDPDFYTQELAISMIQCFNCVFCCCGCNNNNNINNNKNDNCCSTSNCNNNNNNNNNNKCTCCNINFENNIINYNQQCPRPYIVYSKIHREYCDFNRNEERAFEDDRMKPHYQLYHNTIKRFIGNIKMKHCDTYEQGKVMLLDIHGQSDLKEYILRGTKDTKTVEPLLKSLGRESLVGVNSILGYLNSNGCKVFPNNLPSDFTMDPTNTEHFITKDKEIEKIQKLAQTHQFNIDQPYKSYFQEHPEFSGAFTVMYYSKQYPINTIQVEVGFKWRSTKDYRIEFSRLLRTSILNFLNCYKIN